MNSTIRLHTPRLELIATDAQILRADTGERARLSALIDAVIPAGWPPELYEDHQEQFARKVESGEWPVGFAPWYWVHRGPGAQRTLCGNGGFFRIPDPPGTLMCGYSMVPEFEGRGLATEAMRRLFAWAFGLGSVDRIIGDTFPHLVKSIRVMTKLGMTPTDPGEEVGTIRFAIARSEFGAIDSCATAGGAR